MPVFTVNRTFQYEGAVRRELTELTITKEMLDAEIAKGKHPDNGKLLSGLLNHSSPADEATAALVKDLCVKETEAGFSDEDKAERMEKIKGDFDALGKAYHPGWTLGRLEKELAKAKKEVGDAAEATPKKETVRPQRG